MHQVLQTTLLTDAEALRLALTAEDIPSHISGRSLSGVLPIAFTVWIEEDGDLERALLVRDALQHPEP